MCWMVLGTVLSIGSSVMQGIQANRDAKAAAQVQEMNAQRALQVAAAEEEKFRYRADRLQSTQRLASAISGVDGQVGSPLSVAQETARQLELDALTIRYGGQADAARYRTEARYLKAQGKQALVGGLVRGGTTLLTSDMGWPGMRGTPVFAVGASNAVGRARGY